MEIVYCIDTSSLIEMKDKYPMDVNTFKPLWVNTEKLIKDDRLIAPLDVKKEIEKGDDELSKWAKNKKKLFVSPDKKQLEKVKEILKNYPFLADSGKPGLSKADPWLIALAVERNTEEQQKLDFSRNRFIVVTEESKINPNKIPAVCKNYGIECINLIELFRKEKW